MMSNEPDVEYTEVVHTRAADSAQGKQFSHPFKLITHSYYFDIYFLSVLHLLALQILLLKTIFAAWPTFLNS